MTNEPTTSDIFSKRAEQWNQKAPVFAAVCRAIAAEPQLAAPVTTDAAAEQHGSVWSRPHRLFAAITRVLRTTASRHPLAEYWSTLGGNRAADADLPAAV